MDCIQNTGEQLQCDHDVPRRLRLDGRAFILVEPGDLTMLVGVIERAAAEAARGEIDDCRGKIDDA